MNPRRPSLTRPTHDPERDRMLSGRFDPYLERLHEACAGEIEAAVDAPSRGQCKHSPKTLFLT